MDLTVVVARVGEVTAPCDGPAASAVAIEAGHKLRSRAWAAPPTLHASRGLKHIYATTEFLLPTCAERGSQRDQHLPLGLAKSRHALLEAPVSLKRDSALSLCTASLP